MNSENLMAPDPRTSTDPRTNPDPITNIDKHRPPIDFLDFYRRGKLPELTQEKLICELQLLTLGNFFALRNLKIDLQQFQAEAEAVKSLWRPYLQRPNRYNNRSGICLVGLPGDSPSDSFSIPEARARTGRELMEADFNTPTSAFSHFQSLSPVLNLFPQLGRTMLIRSDEAGWFPPHRDGKWLARDCFRIVAFLTNTGPGKYDWILDEQKLHIDEGSTYYLNTRLEHRTFCYCDNSIRLVVNVPVTLENVLRVLTYA